MDLEAKIKPALNTIHGKELTTEEFQKMLFDYFQDKGIMNNLQTHLRAQMINVLKETAIGKMIMHKKTEISPKIQALNLLIAEYLLRRNYHYTLSVMSSEVPLNNAFPPLSPSDDGQNIAFHFSKNDTYDILEAMGITKIPKFANMLEKKYHLQGCDSLLACMLQTIPTMSENYDSAKSECFKNWLSKHDLQAMDLELLIKMFKETGVDIDVILQVIEQLKIVIINEVKRLKDMKDAELRNLQRHMSYETRRKIQKYKTKVTDLEAFYIGEKNRLEAELKKTKDNLASATSNIQLKYNQASGLNENIKMLEKRLKQQEESLLVKEQVLQQRQELLEMKQSRIDQQFDQLVMLNQTLETGTCTSKVNIVPQIHEQPSEDNLQLKEENEQLRKHTLSMSTEIDVLKGQNNAYQSKIQQLLSRTSDLLTQLEKRSARTLEIPKSPRRNSLPRESRGCQISPRLPYTSTSLHAVAEEVSFPSCLNAQALCNFLTSREIRKQRCLVSATSSDNESSEDILKEARDRLLELERESDALDKHFNELPATTLRSNSEPHASGILQNFQENMSMIRNRLTKLFGESRTTNTQTIPISTSIGQSLPVQDDHCPPSNYDTLLPIGDTKEMKNEINTQRSEECDNHTDVASMSDVVLNTTISTLENTRLSSNGDGTDCDKS